MKKISTFYSGIALALLMLSASLLAGDPARTGTSAATQLLVPVGARTMGMGGGNLANVQGLEAMYWNPAGLARLEHSAATEVSTMTIFNDINVNFLGMAASLGAYGNLGVSIKAFDVGEIVETTTEDIDGLSGKTYSPVMMTLGATYGKRLTEAIQFGFTSKVIHESIPRVSATSVAFDMGIQYQTLGGIEGLSFGVAVKNIGKNMKFGGSGLIRNGVDVGQSNQEARTIPVQSDKLPATFEIGVGFHRSISESNSILFSGNFQNNNFGSDEVHLGVEYAFNNLIALRGGYLLADNLPAEEQVYTFALGFGLQTMMGGTELKFDYAFRDAQYFNGSNLFSLTLGF
ncbi:MAG TPA: PorV/PorQ family protein [Calditrichia bacterium]|nr:PorV/PorQ family protein [Calditrichota bacterium]HQV30372.1 PorV/PorQ family protein [Calditrichia bacterium]